MKCHNINQGWIKNELRNWFDFFIKAIVQFQNHFYILPQKVRNFSLRGHKTE